MQELTDLAAVSRRYGADPAYVFGGGGNTSFKTATQLFVKPSGVELAYLQPGDLVKMDRAAIRKVYDYPTPADWREREALVKQVMAAAVCADSRGRPSVEAPLHELLPQRFVVHLHPALVNGLMCAVDGAVVCRQLFPEALCVEYVDPGYTLAVVMERRLRAWREQQGALPEVLFLLNHGVFVAADTLAAVDVHYARIISALQAAYARANVRTELTVGSPAAATVMDVAPQLRTLLGDDRTRATVTASGYFRPAGGPLSPDHICYAKSYAYEGEVTLAALQAFRDQRGYAPVIVAVPDQATFAAAANLKSALTALEAARNAALIAQLTAAFGGPRYLNERERTFIENWEVESYRKQVAAGASGRRRLQDRVAFVTGGAQGFGWGIARGLAAEGATVLLADINEPGVTAAAAELCREFGAERARGLVVNVADEASVARAVATVATLCGGLDVLISNAGVLRAGSVKTLTLKDWQLVTDVNYTGYFLCVKHFAPLLARQQVPGRGGWSDIIEINSKSGLVGSNRNAAYAGSKFGGIGLTQSFALELVEDRIKVNAICPGNYFDGPLWSDPERGLFVQYLRSGKVPGAQSIADVKRAYEAKVPMGRGCLPEDVVKAILYLVEQEYETGQAMPVTGGQVMLG